MDRDTRDRLIKLLGMTGSSHDAEALVAIRKANEFLARNKLTWTIVLSAVPIEPTIRRADPPRQAQTDSYAEMFRFIFRHEPPGALRGQSEWLHLQWKTHGLSTAQKIELGRLYTTVFDRVMSAKFREGHP